MKSATCSASQLSVGEAKREQKIIRFLKISCQYGTVRNGKERYETVQYGTVQYGFQPYPHVIPASELDKLTN